MSTVEKVTAVAVAPLWLAAVAGTTAWVAVLAPALLTRAAVRTVAALR